jgi:hypothetical protein
LIVAYVTALESTGASCHIYRMENDAKSPKMTPLQLKANAGWYVRIIWPDRPKEDVHGFNSEREAREWIKRGSAEWLTRRQEAHNA